MPDLDLRRRIAMLRGYSWMATDVGGREVVCLIGPDTPNLSVLRLGEWRECAAPAGLHKRHFYHLRGDWDSDLGAAGELWAELVRHGVEVQGGSTDIGECDGTLHLRAYWWAHGVGTKVDDVEVWVDANEVPDPAERLARAIARLWLAWREQGVKK